MKVLGIDPGSHIIGYGLVEETSSTKMIDCGAFQYKGVITETLQPLYADVTKLIRESRPDLIAVEKLFLFKNQKTFTDVAQSRGIILLASLEANCPVLEITPLQIKQSVAGYGAADKKALAEMIRRILKLEEIPKPDDITDALAAAVTGLAMARNKHLLKIHYPHIAAS